MITVGLDFGTHQTKVCVERKERAELEAKIDETLAEIKKLLDIE